MTGSVLVGVDSGGTRTNVQICVDSSNRRERSYEVGDALSGSIEPHRYGGLLRKILAPLELHCEQLQAADFPIFVFVSAAGFTQWVRDEFVGAIHDVCPTVLQGRVRAVGVANDAVTLLLGMQADGIVISGTGSNVIMKARDGVVYQVGGHEWVACDYGSGFWIGLEAVRQAFRDFEAGLDSVLLQRLRQIYGLRPDDDKRLIAKMRDLGVADSNMKKEIARFAESVCGAAERGDLAAQNIVKAQAEDLADVTAGALRRRYSGAELSGGVALVQCGSVLANEFYRAAFESQVDMRLRSGFDQRAEIQWERVATGGDAAVNLARMLQHGTNEILTMDVMFRPAVIRF